MIANKRVYEVTKTSFILGIVIFVLVLSLDVALLRQNRKLGESLAAQTSSLAIAVGSNVPSISGLSVDGKEEAIDYGKDPRKTLLFVFSTECGVCTKNWPTWESLAGHVDTKSMRLIYANLSKTVSPEYLSSHKLNSATVLAQLDPKVTVAYDLSLTPQLLLISSQGKVEHVWLGLLKGEQLADMERTLGMRGNQLADSRF